mgnify:CR=1 FL=1
MKEIIEWNLVKFRKPTEEEIKMNSPSRSAKLRVVRKICDASEERLIGLEKD